MYNHVVSVCKVYFLLNKENSVENSSYFCGNLDAVYFSAFFDL